MSDSARVEPVSISAFARLTALRRAELMAAHGILGHAEQNGGYDDFFVEGSGPPWHEAFTDVITGEVQRVEATFSATRMSAIDAIRDNGYDDFFVENGGDGNPWHEAFADAVNDSAALVVDPAARAAALGSLNVVQSYVRLRSATIQP